jgi:hypothetical protein
MRIPVPAEVDRIKECEKCHLEYFGSKESTKCGTCDPEFWQFQRIELNPSRAHGRDARDVRRNPTNDEKRSAN